EQVVIALRVKRRIEIDQVDRLIRNVLPQHLQVVTVVKLVHLRLVSYVACSRFCTLIPSSAKTSFGTISMSSLADTLPPLSTVNFGSVENRIILAAWSRF